jgi:thiamine biosynthesis lipoprotein
MGTITLPDGAGFDPGGIGKGLAADLVSADLAARGIPGGCVNVGGDLRVWGRGPRDDRWRVAAADRTIAVTNVGVATSGTGRRTWVVAGHRMHHLIDPNTLDPADSGVTAVTVIAPAAWQAEVYALAALLSGPTRACAELRRWGVDGLVVDDRGRVHASRRLLRRP